VLDSSSSSDETLYSSESDDSDSNNEEKHKKNRLKVRNAVDPSEVHLLETSVREHVEEIIREKMEAKGQKCELAGVSDEVCRAIGCQFLKSRHDLCIFHSRMLSFMKSITNGRLCDTIGCERKATNHNSKCTQCQIGDFPRPEKAQNLWSRDKILDISLEIAKKYAAQVKANPRLRLYIGITCRSPLIRVKEHIRVGKEFDCYDIAVEVQNLYDLADIEYNVLRFLSQMIETKHLIDKVAGGEFKGSF